MQNPIQTSIRKKQKKSKKNKTQSKPQFKKKNNKHAKKKHNPIQTSIRKKTKKKKKCKKTQNQKQKKWNYLFSLRLFVFEKNWKHIVCFLFAFFFFFSNWGLHWFSLFLFFLKFFRSRLKAFHKSSACGLTIFWCTVLAKLTTIFQLRGHDASQTSVSISSSSQDTAEVVYCTVDLSAKMEDGHWLPNKNQGSIWFAATGIGGQSWIKQREYVVCQDDCGYMTNIWRYTTMNQWHALSRQTNEDITSYHQTSDLL